MNFEMEEAYEPLPSELESFPSSDVLNSYLTQEAENNSLGFLDGHAVDPKKRGTLLKWISEVLEAYDLQDATYFKTVDIMNRYFKQTDKVLGNGDLHLVGVSCMRLATTIVEPRGYDILVSTLNESICFGKFTTEQLKSIETDIFVTLQGNLDVPTCLDFLQLYVAQQGMWYAYERCVKLLKLLQFYHDIPFQSHDQAVAVLLLIPNSGMYISDYQHSELYCPHDHFESIAMEAFTRLNSFDSNFADTLQSIYSTELTFGSMQGNMPCVWSSEEVESEESAWLQLTV